LDVRKCCSLRMTPYLGVCKKFRCVYQEFRKRLPLSLGICLQDLGKSGEDIFGHDGWCRLHILSHDLGARMSADANPIDSILLSLAMARFLLAAVWPM